MEAREKNQRREGEAPSGEKHLPFPGEKHLTLSVFSLSLSLEVSDAIFIYNTKYYNFINYLSNKTD
jgi:hypothetical protein